MKQNTRNKIKICVQQKQNICVLKYRMYVQQKHNVRVEN